MQAGGQVATCLNIELMRKESIAPFLSLVICEDLFPSVLRKVSFPRKKGGPYYMGTASCGKHL